MATFSAQIIDLVGEAFTDTAAMSQFMQDGVRQLVNLLPPNRLVEIVSTETLDTDDPTFILTGANYTRGRVVNVSRENAQSIKQLCRQIPVSLASRAQDPEDLIFATETDPVYYISAGVLTVLPAPTNNKTAEVAYVNLPAVVYGDEKIDGFPNDLEPIVVLYAAVKAAQWLLASEEDEDLYVPIITSLKADYVQAISLLGAKVGDSKGSAKESESLNTKTMQKMLNQMLEYGK